MAQSKLSDNLIRLKCGTCSALYYYARKNRKKVERKIELSKYCPVCRKHTPHKEAKLK